MQDADILGTLQPLNFIIHFADVWSLIVHMQYCSRAQPCVVSFFFAASLSLAVWVSFAVPASLRSLPWWCLFSICNSIISQSQDSSNEWYKERLELPRLQEIVKSVLIPPSVPEVYSLNKWQTAEMQKWFEPGLYAIYILETELRNYVHCPQISKYQI